MSKSCILAFRRSLDAFKWVERARRCLNLLASGSRRLGVVELSKFLDLPKGTVHGILATLQHIGFVEQDRVTGKYQLGGSLLHLGNSYLDVNELRTRAINWADSLASRSREAVQIGTQHDGRVLVVHHVFRPDDSVQTMQVGALLPAHATALGKVLLANDPGRDPDDEDWAPLTTSRSSIRWPSIPSCPSCSTRVGLRRSASSWRGRRPSRRRSATTAIWSPARSASGVRSSGSAPIARTCAPSLSPSSGTPRARCPEISVRTVGDAPRV